MFSRAMSWTIMISGSISAAMPVGFSFSTSCRRYHRAVARMIQSRMPQLISSARTFFVMEISSSGRAPVAASTTFPSGPMTKPA